MSEATGNASKYSGWTSWWYGREGQLTKPQQDLDVTQVHTNSSDHLLSQDSENDRRAQVFTETNGTVHNSTNNATNTTPEGTTNTNSVDNTDGKDNLPVGWYSSIVSKVSSIPMFHNKNPDFILDGDTKYSQLNSNQVHQLESEALQAIMRHSNSWLWFEDLTELNGEISGWGERCGVVSVHGTGSLKCPLPMKNYPVADINPGYQVYLKDSVILPSDSPLETLHTQSMISKVATAVKHYYNFPTEKHLYLKENTEGILRNGKALVISVVGTLPDKYEKFSLGDQRSAHYLSKKLALSLQHELPLEINSLSLECPLSSKDLKTAFHECIVLLKNWKHLFKDVSSIFFVSVYHSVPLAILLAKHILKDYDPLEINPAIPVGILAIESNLQGYRFWDHSSDATGSSEQEYQKVQQAREKQLFQGVNKNEKEILSKIRLYRKLDSEESRLIQQNLDWLLYNWRGFRLNLFGKLYDNFMTASQKLAVDYTHPKIFRNLWCDGRYMGHDTKHPLQLEVPDVDLKTPKFECKLQIPEKRVFEITLLNDILLALNLGNTKFVPIMKLISPFFISRSFNENTMSPNLRKLTQTEMKNWLQEMDMKWRSPETPEQLQNELPDRVSSVHKFLEFAQYHAYRSPELMQVYSNIYDDDFVFQTFIENTIKARSPLNEKHLALLDDHSTPRSILNTVNQYDLVWKFHEFLSEFMKLRNLPHQSNPQSLNFAISLEYSFWRQVYADPTFFKRDSSESIRRLENMWETYQTWDPPTRGLNQLKKILSVLSLYNNASELLQDVERK